VKQILFILLFSSMARGQNYLMCDTMPNLPPNNVRYDWKQELIQAWHLYEADCYKDSIPSIKKVYVLSNGYRIFKDIGEIVDSDFINATSYIYYDTLWTRKNPDKQPPSDFIKWLEKK
jgi:hypothetical protein